MESEQWEKVYRALAYFLSLHESLEITNMIGDDNATIEDIKKRLDDFKENSKREIETGFLKTPSV